MAGEDGQLKLKVFDFLYQRVLKTLAKLDKKPLYANKLREYVCFCIKTLEDCFRHIKSDSELADLILTLKTKIIEILCKGAEYDDLTVRN
jgi:hypothetical protein